MAETPVLGLPLMENGQGGSSVIYNEAMTILDTATGGGGGSGVPGGANGQAQYKSGASTFGGSSGLTLDAIQVTAITLASPLSLDQGGTGAATQVGAQAALGLVPGTTVQPFDAELSALAALTSASDRLPYFTGAGSAALAVFTSVARAFLDDPDTATQRATLGLKALAVLDTVGTPQIDNSAVTYAKIQNVSGPPRVLGRYSAGAGPVQELLLGSGLTVDGAGVITAAAGGGGAPTDAEYITSTAHASLSAERVLTDTATITWDRSTAGQIKASAVGGGGYTDEQAQDAVGAMLLDTATIDLLYTDATPALSADVKDASITEAKLGFSDVTTKDASTTAHGLLRKLSGTPTQYLDGSGAWTTPAGGGANYWTRASEPSSLTAGLLAFWPLEEASGNRLDSVGTNHLVPQGTVAQITNAAGKIGQALSMNATAGTYLSVADNPALSAGPNMSFTLACWVYVINATSAKGLVGKGSAAVNNNNVEYALYQQSGTWNFLVGSGSSSVDLASPTAPVASTWTLLIGWYDHVADLQYIQVNNGTPTQIANAVGSHDSALPFEMGHMPGITASLTLNGRLDMPCFWKRVLTAQERTDLWNGGNGLAYPFGAGAGFYLAPLTTADTLLLGAARVSTERLEVDGAIKLGTTTGATDGTVRWSGTDFEGRKGGGWVSMTGAGGGGAPTDAEYITSTAHASLSAERVLTDTATITWDRATAGQIKANAVASGGQPLDATLTALAGLTTGANLLPYFTGVDTVTTTTLTAFMRGLLDDPDLATAQATLGITGGGGYTDEQAQDAVGTILVDSATIDLTYTDATPSITAAIVAGSVGTTQLTNANVTYAKIQNVTDARLLGRSAGSAGVAQEITVAGQLSLSGGVLTGTGQPLDATLTTIAALAGAANQMLYFTGTDVAALTALSAYARTLLDDGDATTARGTLGLGTLAVQNANAVAITGGTATLTSLDTTENVTTANAFVKLNTAGDNRIAFYTMQQSAGGTGRFAIFCGGNAPNQLQGNLGLYTNPDSFTTLDIRFTRDGRFGLVLRPSDNDTGGFNPVILQNVAGTTIGSITTTASVTAFNTSSDVRLKHAIAPLAGALDVVRRLRPITHLWNADGSRGYGFLAHELQRDIPDAVTGHPDAVHEDGSVNPQQVDHSKLVPWLTAALQEAVAQVQALAARVASLEEQLGV